MKFTTNLEQQSQAIRLNEYVPYATSSRSQTGISPSMSPCSKKTYTSVDRWQHISRLQFGSLLGPWAICQRATGRMSSQAHPIRDSDCKTHDNVGTHYRSARQPCRQSPDIISGYRPRRSRSGSNQRTRKALRRRRHGTTRPGEAPQAINENQRVGGSMKLACPLNRTSSSSDQPST
jgi:hypothetical protein